MRGDWVRLVPGAPDFSKLPPGFCTPTPLRVIMSPRLFSQRTDPELQPSPTTVPIVLCGKSSGMRALPFCRLVAPLHYLCDLGQVTSAPFPEAGVEFLEIMDTKTLETPAKKRPGPGSRYSTNVE